MERENICRGSGGGVREEGRLPDRDDSKKQKRKRRGDSKKKPTDTRGGKNFAQGDTQKAALARTRSWKPRAEASLTTEQSRKTYAQDESYRLGQGKGPGNGKGRTTLKALCSAGERWQGKENNPLERGKCQDGRRARPKKPPAGENQGSPRAAGVQSTGGPTLALDFRPIGTKRSEERNYVEKRLPTNARIRRARIDSKKTHRTRGEKTKRREIRKNFVKTDRPNGDYS